MPAASAPDSNPLNEDSKLKSLLNDVGSVDSIEGFNEWRSSFLDLYTQYLDSKGSEKAEATYTKFGKTSGGLEKVVIKLQGLIDKGDLSTEKVSVKARMSMSELKAKLGTITKELERLLPSTDKEIQSFGFSKWHVGAVLVRDGFTEYAVMMHSRAILKVLRVSALDDVADRQILDEIQYFGKKFDIFCSIMADLGLMSVCEKATQLIHGDMLKEAREAEATARTLNKEKLSASQHGAAMSNKNKSLNTDRLSPYNSPQKKDGLTPVRGRKGKLDITRLSPFTSPANKTPTTFQKQQLDMCSISPLRTPSKAVKAPIAVEKQLVFDDESSYETIEEIITVISYETVEREDDSSYETIEEIDPPSEYETDEEEIEVSEYETDTDSESDTRSKGKSSKKKKSKAKRKEAIEKNSKSPKKIEKESSDSSSSEEDSDSKPSKRSVGDRKKGRPPPTNDDEDNSGGDEDEQESDSASDASDDSDLPPPIKYGSSKPHPEPHPDPNHDPYKPTERMKYRKLKHYYHGDPSTLFPFRNRNKKKAPEPKPKPPPKKKEKKLRRVLHKKMITIRRKLAKAPPKKIRVKKEKPPVKVHVKRERKAVKRMRVKKGTGKPIPESIVITRLDSDLESKAIKEESLVLQKSKSPSRKNSKSPVRDKKSKKTHKKTKDEKKKKTKSKKAIDV